MTAPDAAGRGPRRPDAAGQLLRDITFNPLDPGYHAARKDPSRRDRRPGARWLSVPVIASLAVLGLLAGGAVGQLRTAPPGAGTRAALLEQVEQRNAAADELAAANVQRREEIQRLETALLSDEQRALALSLERLAVPAGAVRVAGPGIRVTLDDPATDDGPLLEGGGEDPELSRVLDVDVQQVVNGLWGTGAEAVAVNGQRLTTLSAIRSAGDAILVDYRPLAPPYVIEAIGDPDALADETRTGATGGFLAWLRTNYGVQATVAGVDRLTLAAAVSVRLDHAQPYRASRPPLDPSPTPSPAPPAAVPGSPP